MLTACLPRLPIVVSLFCSAKRFAARLERGDETVENEDLESLWRQCNCLCARPSAGSASGAPDSQRCAEFQPSTMRLSDCWTAGLLDCWTSRRRHEACPPSAAPAGLYLVAFALLVLALPASDEAPLFLLPLSLAALSNVCLSVCFAFALQGLAAYIGSVSQADQLRGPGGRQRGHHVRRMHGGALLYLPLKLRR